MSLSLSCSVKPLIVDLSARSMIGQRRTLRVQVPPPQQVREKLIPTTLGIFSKRVIGILEQGVSEPSQTVALPSTGCLPVARNLCLVSFSDSAYRSRF